MNSLQARKQSLRSRRRRQAAQRQPLTTEIPKQLLIVVNGRKKITGDVLEAALVEALADINNKLYEKGWEEGWKDGYHNGRAEGIKTGYKEGKIFVANLPKDPLE